MSSNYLLKIKSAHSDCFARSRNLHNYSTWVKNYWLNLYRTFPSLQNKLNQYLTISLQYNCIKLHGLLSMSSSLTSFNKVEPDFRSHKGQNFLIFPSPAEVHSLIVRSGSCCEISAFDDIVIESVCIHSLNDNFPSLGKRSINNIRAFSWVTLKSLSSPKKPHTQNSFR